MLIVRLPQDLEARLASHCKKHKLQKSEVVRIALRQYLLQAKGDPLLALIGSGNGKYCTEVIMRMSRGEDFDLPAITARPA